MGDFPLGGTFDGAHQHQIELNGWADTLKQALLDFAQSRTPKLV
jgi:hypothetical protein